MAFFLGVLVSSAWMLVNGFFLMRLVRMAAEVSAAEGLKRKNKVFMLSVIKFPVLYLVGFFILKTRFFSIGGIVTGLTISLLVFALFWLRTKPVLNARSLP